MSISRSDSSRFNGSQSSGPVTPEGKAVSSQNALKTGIFSKRRLLSDEDPAAYEALVNALNSAFNPATVVEHLLIDRAAMARQRIARLERAEAASIELERNAFKFEMDDQKWSRYGGRGLQIRLPSLSEAAKAETVPVRDALVNSSLSLAQDAEKFARLSASLHREFDTALRQLREEQSRRVNALPIERAAVSPKANEAGPADED